MQPDNIANDYLKRNRISLLATGSEILQGETLDSNCQHFAHKIHQKGGILFQHLQTSDTLSEILQGVAYLLKHSDALIICGGLGPTSDDNTRFALSEYTQLPLTLNAQAWSHI